MIANNHQIDLSFIEIEPILAINSLKIKELKFLEDGQNVS
jgi:hypothetical protein